MDGYRADGRSLYSAEMTLLISGGEGRVYLDKARPRVCIRGPEDSSRDDLGYPWLADDEVFPFYELRAAAVDLRGKQAFDADEAARRVAAQLDTLIEHGVRHAVLSAFGCGAFLNPADQVARIVRSIRQLEMKKAPSVSETLDWARTLVLLGLEHVDAETATSTVNILLKYQTDIAKATKEFAGSSAFTPADAAKG